jgi:hypothetical protein|tara:strand:+ start:519 stop:752 length:234 start_codon:yes stop_codon:yes gene_type:complete
VLTIIADTEPFKSFSLTANNQQWSFEKPRPKSLYLRQENLRHLFKRRASMPQSFQWSNHQISKIMTILLPKEAAFNE